MLHAHKVSGGSVEKIEGHLSTRCSASKTPEVRPTSARIRAGHWNWTEQVMMGTPIVVHETSFVAQAATSALHQLGIVSLCDMWEPFSATKKIISSLAKVAKKQLENTERNSISGCIWLYVV